MQSTLLPECLDDWISEDNPVRAIDVFVDELELVGGGFPHRVSSEPLLAGFWKLLRPAVIEVLVDALSAASSATLSSPRKPSNTMRILSSAEKCRRVARRISRMVFSALSGLRSSLCLIVFPPEATTSPKLSLRQSAQSVQHVLTGNLKHPLISLQMARAGLSKTRCMRCL